MPAMAGVALVSDLPKSPGVGETYVIFKLNPQYSYTGDFPQGVSPGTGGYTVAKAWGFWGKWVGRGCLGGFSFGTFPVHFLFKF